MTTVGQKKKVAIARFQTDGTLKEQLDTILDLVDWKSKIGTGSKVVVKPNLVSPINLEGINTHPELIYAVVSKLRDRATSVLVGESDIIRYSRDAMFETTGLKEGIVKAGGAPVNFTKEPHIQISCNGLYIRKIRLPRIIVECDAFVSVPIVKSHEITHLTCALKNQFGCIADRHRIMFHHHLDEVIVDLNKVINPDLVITDSISCMEGAGPLYGKVQKLNLILASDNSVANDLVVCDIIGFDPEKVEHLKLAIKERLGPGSLSEIDIKTAGFDYESIRTNFAPPHPDRITKLMIEVVYKSYLLTWLVCVSPLFRPLNWITWEYRKLRGRRPIPGVTGYA